MAQNLGLFVVMLSFLLGCYGIAIVRQRTK